MALIACKECGKEVSSTAQACPGCGAPISSRKPAPKTSGCAWLALIFLAIPFLAVLAGVVGRNGAPAQPVVSDAACRADLQCWGDRQAPLAEGPCRRAVEALAKYQAEWTDGVLESKFSRFAWADKPAGTLNYLGDKVKFQNGFGAWQTSRYACTFDPATRSATAVVFER